MSPRITSLALALSLGLPTGAALADHHEGGLSAIEATVVNTEGEAIGSVRLDQTATGVLVTASVDGLPEGEHAFHIHGKGLCDAADGFKSAGGHFEPGSHVHGIKDPAGPHAGDMPNQFVGADGELRAQVLNTAVSLGDGANTIADADGSALVIHAGADDYLSQPSGAAGGRIACAVLSAPRE